MMRFSKMRGTNMPPLRGSAYLTREGFAATDMSPRWGSAYLTRERFAATDMSPRCGSTARSQRLTAKGQWPKANSQWLTANSQQLLHLHSDPRKHPQTLVRCIDISRVETQCKWIVWGGFNLSIGIILNLFVKRIICTCNDERIIL